MARTDLILWRHAEAEAAGASGSDLERPLTPRGDRQARAVARWLVQHRPKQLHIRSSPALRCLQTAQTLGLAYDIDDRLAPAATAADLLAAASAAGGGAVLLVGHQPTLGRLAALLLCAREADWAIKKGGLWWFSRRDGEATTSLRAVIGPDLL